MSAHKHLGNQGQGVELARCHDSLFQSRGRVAFTNTASVRVQDKAPENSQIMTSSFAPPALSLTILSTSETTTIEKLRAGGVLLLGKYGKHQFVEPCAQGTPSPFPAISPDFWTTRCERCPAMLDTLEQLAGEMGENGGVVFASVNCDDADFAQELIEEQ